MSKETLGLKTSPNSKLTSDYHNGRVGVGLEAEPGGSEDSETLSALQNTEGKSTEKKEAVVHKARWPSPPLLRILQASLRRFQHSAVTGVSSP